MVSPVQVVVKNTLDTRRVYNVLATLRGTTEPGQSAGSSSVCVGGWGGGGRCRGAGGGGGEGGLS